ncbi:restriction endonuclease subunit S [Pseudomonas fluorescens]|uniref:Type I restriction modification DNA specificity domain-containing protein n=1 Tax=Pseudomonas fluorescens TaxID=294 RepID=A0A5E7V0S1_PSEFL|nr:restriction endonuclease subunit S [Pseudomonas fluorescens]VVQ16853.1 hypothetical protein PS928_04450 [Pseudomonas fluorescens]
MSSEWHSYRLDEIGRIVTGKTPKSGIAEFVGNDVPFVTPPDFEGNKWICQTTRRISAAAAQSVKNNIIPARSVLVTCIGSDMGKAALIESESVTNQQINAVVVDETKFCPEFLYYNLALRKIEIRNLAGGSAQPILNKTAFGQLRVDCPPLLEQKALVELLCPLDDRISLLRETNATLEAIAQALFKSWFVDFDPVRAKAEGLEPEGVDAATAALFPDSFEESELGLIPSGWRGASLADLADFQNGYAFKSKDWVATGHPVVKIGDVKPGIIDLVGCSFVTPETTRGLDRFKLERGSLLVGMTGYVGETGLVPTVNPSAYLNQRVGRFSTANGLADLSFVYCLVRNPAFKIFAEAQSHGSAQANVSGTALIAYPVVIPSSDVLEQFNRAIAPVLESILSNHEQAQNLAQLRDTLLPRLISGQLRLPEAVMVEEACA